MYKKAMRNMQRAGLKTGTGLIAVADKAEQPLPMVEQARLAEAKRLARIRRAFEIEKEIERLLAKGENVSALHKELAAVRSGKQEVSLRLARDLAPLGDHVAVTVHRKRGPERTPYDERRQPQPSRSETKKTLSPLAVEADLVDLSKEKVTLSGIAIVKILLLGFDVETIAQTLKARATFLEKIRDSHLFTLAPMLETDDALVVVDVLEKRLTATLGAPEKANSNSRADEAELATRNPHHVPTVAQGDAVTEPELRKEQAVIPVNGEILGLTDTPTTSQEAGKPANFLRTRKKTFTVVKVEGGSARTLEDADSQNGLRLTMLLDERKRLQAALDESLEISRVCREKIKKLNADIALLQLR